MKLGRTQLKQLFADVLRKRTTDNMFATLIDSLWRDPLQLYREKATVKLEFDEFGDPIDPYQKSTIIPEIKFGQALGQDNLIEGNRSAAFGQGLQTKSFLELVLGAHNIIPTDQNATEWIPTDVLLTLGNGPDPENRSNVFVIFKNGLIRFQVIPEVWIVDHYEKILTIGDVPEPDTITEETENYTGEGIHTHKLEIPTKGITEIVKTILDNNHESFLIDNTANASETIISSWTVVPWAEQVGEFKAVIMVRNKVTNTIVTLISLLSFDYADATDVVIQNDLLTDSGITLTVGVNGSNYLYATVSGMPTVNKRIHICLERCVLSHREYTIYAEGNFELNGSALASSIVAMQSPEFDFNLSMNAVLIAEGLMTAAADFQLNATALLTNHIDNPCLASLPNNLIAYYKLNETSGAVVDSIGGFNLTLNGTVTRAEAGKLGNCFYFSGAAGAYCSGSTPLAGKKEWTISFWVKMHRSQTADQSMISGVSTAPAFTPNIAQRSTSKVSTGWSSSAYNFTASIDAVNKDIDTWYLITQRGYLDIATDTLYYKGSINNVHQNYSNQAGASFTDIQGTLVLGRHGNTTAPFQGWLDDIKIWDRQLTDCEINANYNSGNGVEL